MSFIAKFFRDATRTVSNKFYSPVSHRLATGPYIDSDILHALMGICTEAGELLDVPKKAMFYGKSVDYVNLDEEIGDVMWYIALYCETRAKQRGYTSDQIFAELCARNIAKLRARFPEKFTEHHAENRDLVKERSVLEGNLNSDDYPGKV